MNLSPDAILEFQHLCYEMGIPVDNQLLDLGEEVMNLTSLSIGKPDVLPLTPEEWDRLNSQ